MFNKRKHRFTVDFTGASQKVVEHIANTIVEMGFDVDIKYDFRTLDVYSTRIWDEVTKQWMD